MATKQQKKNLSHCAYMIATKVREGLAEEFNKLGAGDLEVYDNEATNKIWDLIIEAYALWDRCFDFRLKRTDSKLIYTKDKNVAWEVKIEQENDSFVITMQGGFRMDESSYIKVKVENMERFLGDCNNWETGHWRIFNVNSVISEDSYKKHLKKLEGK